MSEPQHRSGAPSGRPFGLAPAALWRRVIAAILFSVAAGTNAADPSVTTGQREDGRLFWAWQNDGFSVRLTQLQPDQIHAFYGARGLSRDAVSSLANTCLFQTEVLNARQDHAVTLPLARWILTSGGERSAPMRVDDWKARWKDNPLSLSSYLALRWALFPEAQTFRPGDRNWGMLSTGLRNGAVFDLQLVWEMGGEMRTARIPQLRCVERK